MTAVVEKLLLGGVLAGGEEIAQILRFKIVDMIEVAGEFRCFENGGAEQDLQIFAVFKFVHRIGKVEGENQAEKKVIPLSTGACVPEAPPDFFRWR